MALLDFSAFGELVDTAPVSENPDREFYQSGVTGSDRQFEPEALPKRGERGTDVSNMQQALVDAGVTSIRKVDGAFGINTEKGVQEFQEMNGLPETGIFDEATRSALFDDKTRMPDSDETMVPAPAPVSTESLADDTVTKQYTDDMFTVSNNRVKPDLAKVKEFAKETFDNPVAAAAFVSTVEAESATDLVERGYSKGRALEVFVERNRRADGTLSPAMQRRKDRLDALPSNASGDQIFDIVYDRPSMGNTEAGDGSRYKGRGLIMLTGKDNYRKIGDLIGVDLVANPDLLETDQDVMLRATLAYLRDKKFETKDLTQDKLASIIGHSDDAAGTEARRRWRRAQTAYADMFGEPMPVNGNTDSAPTESLRPVARPETD